jgi:putative intracellular protease/amidase
MEDRICYLFLFDGFADWEPAHITSSLTKYTNFKVKTFSTNGQIVSSMGNLKIMPDSDLATVLHEKFDLLLLPGGDLWEQNGNTEIVPLINNCFQKKITIAAICAATLILGKSGIFKHIHHTSNGLQFLRKNIPNYDDDERYIHRSAVTDQNVITANGAAMLEFSFNVFEHFKVFSETDLQTWFDLYKSGGIYL